MALFTDGDWTDIAALESYESSILDVARTHEIDLEEKIALAANEAGDEILNFLLDHPAQDPKAAVRRRVGLRDTVLTPVVRRWITVQALAATLRDAHHRQMNDRLKGKWEAYERQAAVARARVWQQGIGLVHEPIARAKAPYVDLIAGAPTSSPIYAQVSWLNARGEEGAASAPTAVMPTPGSAAVIGPADPPASAAWWRVYAGFDRDRLTMQATDLPLGAVWTPTDGLSVSGPAPSGGQEPDAYVTGGLLLRRG